MPPRLALLIGILAVSASSILIRYAQADQAPSLVIAAWRLVFASAILLPLALTRRRAELRRLSLTDYLLALFAGVMLAVHFAAWISSLEYTSIASSTVLVATSPLWVGLASPFLLREPLERGVKVGIALALIGSLIITLNEQGGGTRPAWGNFLALVGAWSVSAYFIIGRQLRVQVSLLTYTTLVYSMAALTLVGAALLTGRPLLGHTPTAYLLFLLMALIPQLLGHSSFNYALGYLPAAYVMVATVSEPMGASLLALLLLGEVPSWLTLVGGGFILGGVIIAGRRSGG